MLPNSITLEISGAGISKVHSLSGPSMTLGRSAGNDLVLEDDLVSRNHAVIELRGEDLSITDLGSSNGTQINGTRISPNAPHPLRDGDVIALEPFALAVRIAGMGETQVIGAPQDNRTVVRSSTPAPVAQPAPPPPPAPAPASVREAPRPPTGAPPPAPRPAPVAAGPVTITIGRAPESDMVLDDPLVSRRHARLVVESPSQAYIEDLGSSNGTFVENSRVAAGQRSKVVSGSNVWMGNTHLMFNGRLLVAPTTTTGIRIEALDLNKVTSRGTNLLQHISLSIEPQEFVVIVGPSGAGKSTLLGALSGLWPATDGQVFVNAADLYENFDAMRTNIGYVPQDDIIHRELPVRASLDYAARLRLPADTTSGEREARVTAVVEALGLGERQEIPVGNLSGGQRKRVSIGVELLTSPGLFFLDEATSGLDPGTEAQMMRMLRALANEGHTIILVTHATKNVTMCDRVIFLSRGGYLAYYGPPAEALTYFGVEDFDQIYEKLDGELTPEEWGKQYYRSDLYTEQIENHLSHGRPDAAASSTGQAGKVSTSPRFFSQLMVLSRRYIDIIRRDRINLAMMLLTAPVLGMIDFLAWPSYVLDPVEGDLRRSIMMMFLSSLIPFLVGAIGSIREVVKEGPIYRRERAAGLGVLPYVLSKIWVMGLISFYSATVLTAIKYVAIDYGDLETTNILQMYGTIFLVVFSGSMWGLVLSAIVPREDRVMHLLLAIIVLQIVFSGGLLPLGKLGTTGTVLGSVTSVNWALRGMAGSLEIDTARCLGEAAADCDLPSIQRYETVPERLVVINVIEEDFGGVLGSNVYDTWMGMGAILGVLFVLFVVLQKLKDRAK